MALFNKKITLRESFNTERHGITIDFLGTPQENSDLPLEKSGNCVIHYYQDLGINVFYYEMSGNYEFLNEEQKLILSNLYYDCEHSTVENEEEKEKNERELQKIDRKVEFQYEIKDELIIQRAYGEYGPVCDPERDQTDPMNFVYIYSEKTWMLKTLTDYADLFDEKTTLYKVEELIFFEDALEQGLIDHLIIKILNFKYEAQKLLNLICDQSVELLKKEEFTHLVVFYSENKKITKIEALDKTLDREYPCQHQDDQNCQFFHQNCFRKKKTVYSKENLEFSVSETDVQPSDRRSPAETTQS